MVNLSSLSFEQFTELVHDALNHLYDSPYLQTHPLSQLFSDPRNLSLHRSQNLRRVLLDAIRSMHPGPGVPAQSLDWRAYRILELRYIEGLTPADVMAQIALAKSQYFREQARILEAVTAILWEHAQAPTAPKPDNLATHEQAPATRHEMASIEAERLCTQAVWEAVDVGSLLDELQGVLLSLGRVKDVSVQLSSVSDLVVAHADRVMLRQAILNIVSYGFDMAPGGCLTITHFAERGKEGIHICAQMLSSASIRHTQTESPAGRQGIGLEICYQLMQAMGGSLVFANQEATRWDAYLVWPRSEAPIVLVIDDNSGFVNLVARYLASYDWQVAGAIDGASAERILSKAQPTVIILDVMMPKQDGWEVLRALKLTTKTREIPVIICSVLNEPELAIMLGAVAYLPKPVSQQALLQELARWG